MIRNLLFYETTHKIASKLQISSLKSSSLLKNSVLGKRKQVIYCYSKQKPSQLIVQHSNKYLYLLNSLKDVSQFQLYLSQANHLLTAKENFHTYKNLKLFINDMLITFQIISWAQAYHTKDNRDFYAKYLRKIEDLIAFSFSPKLSASHESIQQEASQFFQTLRFSTYFEVVQQPSTLISNLYLNSYIHINRQRNPQQFVKVYEALRQLNRGEAQSQIMLMTQSGIHDYISNWGFGNIGSKMSEIEMTIFLTHVKGKLSTKSAQQLLEIKGKLLQYLHYERKENESFLHLENVCYCLYISVSELSLNQQISTWMIQKLSSKEQDGVLQYITTLYAHEDKLTCLKVDTWIYLLHYSQKRAQTEEKYQKLHLTAKYVLDQLVLLNFTTWRYKYLVWMLHNLCDKRITNLQLINKVVEAISTHNLAAHRSLYSLTFALKTLEQQLTLSDISNIDVKIANWLSSQSKDSLLSQRKQDLCQILHYADRHPASHCIYLPYLQRLLQVSLSQFQWKNLTELYYFGLKWKAGQTEAGYWRMEYVRRYILNEYAEMGITRRDIPQDSYFYKILSLTTPQHFYKNYIQH